MLDLDVDAATTQRPYDSYVPDTLLRRLAAAPNALVQTVPGTIVFADISGFTRLSERLARSGREGSERLVDAISATFAALLTDARANGGSLLKFGGDALLLWFEGPEHVERACASAFAMRQRLREVGRIPTGASQVVLRMSVGVHSGDYELFLVGGSHRELVVAGPATSTAVAMEGAAEAGQILLSPATAAILPAGCLGAAVGLGVLLARPPAFAAYTEPEFVLPSDADVAACIPVALRGQIGGAGAAAEHRTATVCFLQFGEVDALIARDGAQAAAEAIDAVVRTVQAAAERYQVCFLATDVCADGGRILLSAGAPRVIGDDEERMLLALRAVVEAEPPLPVKIGVNRGHVFTGEVGPRDRRTYAAMGDTTNLAARLMGRAQWGTIYGTRGLLDRCGWRFQTTAVPPFHVKGKAKPVEAWEVGPARQASARATAGRRLPLVGREAETGQLAAALAAARSGTGSLIELVGEQGVGKSRLLREAREQADGLRRLRTTCDFYTQQTPYSAWREPLRQLLDMTLEDAPEVVLDGLRRHVAETAPELDPWLPLLAIAFGTVAPASVAVEQLAAESRAVKLREVVIALLRRELVVPTLFEIEHAGLIDAASAALLEVFTAELPASSWLVIITRRESRGGFAVTLSSAARIDVGPLPEPTLRRLAETTREASTLPPHVLTAAIARASGNPAFLIDLLAAASAGGGALNELPASVGEAAAARIDALAPDDRQLIRRASVLGFSFHPDELERVLPPGTPAPDDAVWQRLVGIFAQESDRRLRFLRPALQEAAHASLPFRMRRSLHAAVGEQIEREGGGTGDPDSLSLHFLHADDHPRTHRYALLGAEQATARFSHDDAARLYRRAIDAGRAAGMERDVRGAGALARSWEELGNALRCTGEPVAAAAALTSARRLLADDALAQARLCHRHAEVAERSGSLTLAVRWLNRALRWLDGLDGADSTIWRARSHSYLGGIRNRQGRWAESAELCREAIREADSVGELSALARACYTLDWALFELGSPDQATHSPRALDIYRMLGDPEHEAAVLNNLGGLAYFQGRWDEAVALYRRAGECSERAGRPADAAFTDCNIGEILSDQGSLAEATGYLERARRVWMATGDPQSVAYVGVLLGRLAVRDGRWSEGVELLEAAVADLRRFRIDAYAELAEGLIAEGEAFHGDPERALALSADLLAASDRHAALLRRINGVAWARLGRHQEALQELSAALAVARARRSDYDVAATLDLLARFGAGDPQAAVERDEILTRLQIQRLPMPPLPQPPLRP